MKLSSKIRLSLLGTAVVPLIVFSAIAYLIIERTLLQSTRDRLELDASAYANTVAGMVELAVEEVASWSKLETLQTVFTGEDLDLRMGLLLRDLNESNHFLEIRCVDTNQEVIAASDFYLVGQSMADDAAVRSALGEIVHVSEVQRFKEDGHAVTIAVPIRAAFDEETIVGCVVAYYDWGNVLNLTGRLNRSYADSHETLALHDTGQRVIATTIADRMLVDADTEGAPERVRGASSLITTPHGFGLRGHADIDRQTALQAARQLAGILLGVAVTSVIAVALVSFLLARVISNPIVGLSRTARKIAEGNLAIRPQYASSDEIGQLAVDLDTMRGNLKEQIDTLDSAVLERTKELETTFEKLKAEMLERAAAETQVDLQQQQLVQADKMASLGILVSGVAHEINNPNGLIALNIPIVREAWGRAKPILEEYADEHGDFSLGAMNYREMCDRMDELFVQMTQSSQRIQSIVGDLKVFAQQRSETEFESVDVNQLVESAVALVGKHLRERTDHLRINHTDDLPSVQGIFQRLEQVLVNLLLNAADSLPNSQRSITVSTTLDAAGNTVSIRVQDEGCGIHSDDLAHITDPFFTTKRELGGTGLGLSVSSGILQEHGGSLTFESEPDTGTLAIVTLPLSGNGNT